MRCFTSFSLKVLTRHLMRNVTVKHAQWWFRIVVATCTTTHILEPPIVLKRKGTTPSPEQLGDSPLFGEPPSSQSRKRRGGRKSRGKKTRSTSAVGRNDFGS